MQSEARTAGGFIRWPPPACEWSPRLLQRWAGILCNAWATEPQTRAREAVFGLVAECPSLDAGEVQLCAPWTLNCTVPMDIWTMDNGQWFWLLHFIYFPWKPEFFKTLSACNTRYSEAKTMRALRKRAWWEEVNSYFKGVLLKATKKALKLCLITYITIKVTVSLLIGLGIALANTSINL